MEAVAAYLHLLSLLTLAGLLAGQCMLCNEHLQPGHVTMLARVHHATLATAACVFVTGVLLLFGFSRGVWFHLTSPVFWIKLVLYVAIVVLTVYPMSQYLRWNRAIAEGRMRVLTTRDIRRTRRVIGVQLAILAVIPLLSVWLARSSPQSH